MDQYMDSYGDNITIGRLGTIAFDRLLTFFFCGNEVKMGGRGGGGCVCLLQP